MATMKSIKDQVLNALAPNLLEVGEHLLTKLKKSCLILKLNISINIDMLLSVVYFNQQKVLCTPLAGPNHQRNLFFPGVNQHLGVSQHLGVNQHLRVPPKCL